MPAGPLPTITMSIINTLSESAAVLPYCSTAVPYNLLNFLYGNTAGRQNGSILFYKPIQNLFRLGRVVIVSQTSTQSGQFFLEQIADFFASPEGQRYGHADL